MNCKCESLVKEAVADAKEQMDAARREDSWSKKYFDALWYWARLQSLAVRAGIMETP